MTISNTCYQQKTIFRIIALLSLAVCVYSRAHGGHSTWIPGSRRHKYSTVQPWDPLVRKRDHLHLATTEVDECCPSSVEIIQPLGGVSKTGRILELYRDQNSTQSFFQTSCKEGVKGHQCRYIVDERRRHSVCVQKYSYTYALVREFDSQVPWRLDYIRVRSGCSCEIQLKKKSHYGRRRKRMARDFV